MELPGPVQLQASTPLVQAVMAAGEPKRWRANTGRVQLMRINRNLSQGASNKANPPLRDGDTVLMNRSGFAVASEVMRSPQWEFHSTAWPTALAWPGALAWPISLP